MTDDTLPKQVRYKCVLCARNALPKLIQASRDAHRYLAALKAEACSMRRQTFTPPGNIDVGGITFRVMRSIDGTLSADEVVDA